MTIKNRVGRFFIPTAAVEDNAENVQRIMCECIVIRCEHMYHSDGFLYCALSSKFDPLESGAGVPSYDVIVHADKIEFKRREE